MVQRILYMLHQVPPYFTTYIILAHLSKLRNSHWYILSNKLDLLQNKSSKSSLQFPHKFSFWDLRSHPGYHMIRSPLIALISYSCDSFSAFPYFGWPGQLGRVLVRYLVRCPPVWGCRMLFSGVDWCQRFGGRMSRRSLLLITPYKQVHDIKLSLWWC